MEGVRIQHDTARNVTFTLVDASRPYRGVYDCGECGRPHVFKTYHLRLDDTGSAIVSQEINDRLQRVGAYGPGGGFRIAGAVAKPPTQIITTGSVTRGRIVEHPVLVEPN